MEIKEYKNYKEAEIRQLYTEVGWTAYTENMPVLEQGYKNSLLVLAAYRIIKVEDGFVFYRKRKSEPDTTRDFT